MTSNRGWHGDPVGHAAAARKRGKKGGSSKGFAKLSGDKQPAATVKGEEN